MKNDQTKEWLEQSLLSPSDAFTDALMDRIEAQQEEKVFSFRPMLARLIGLIVLSGGIPFFLKENAFSIPLIITRIDLPVLPLQICLLIPLLYVLYQTLFLQPKLKHHMGM